MERESAMQDRQAEAHKMQDQETLKQMISDSSDMLGK